METIVALWGKIKGWKTYIASAATVVVAAVYAVFTWDIASAAAIVGLSAQAAALRSAIDAFKAEVEKKIAGE